MTGTDLCVNLATSVPVIFEPPCIYIYHPNGEVGSMNVMDFFYVTYLTFS